MMDPVQLVRDSLLMYYDNFTKHTLYMLLLTSTGVHITLVVASPLVAVWKWYRRGSSDGDTTVPYLFGALNCFLWLRYSFLIMDYKMIAIQVYATLMQTVYLFAICYYRTRKRRVVRSILLLAMLLAFIYWNASRLDHQKATKFVGILATCVQSCAGIICLSFIIRAVRLKSLEFLPFLPVAVTVVVELHTVTYSIVVRDIYLFISNFTFLCGDGTLCALFFVYPSRKTEHKVITSWAKAVHRRSGGGDSPPPVYAIDNDDRLKVDRLRRVNSTESTAGFVYNFVNGPALQSM